MSFITPEIHVTLFGRRKRSEDNTTPVEEPTVDYVAAAEEAAERIGKKAVLGAVVVSVATVAAATLGAIAVKTVEHHLTK